jgi:hypothetical protein
MSAPTTEQPPDAPQDPQEGAEAPQDGQDGPEAVQEPQEDTQGGRGNREAARYRTQLRAAQADLETVRGQVSALQAAAVTRELDALEVPAEVFALAHPDPAEFLADDGTVTRDALVEAVGVVRERYNLRAPTVAPYAPALAPGGSRVSSTASWTDQLQG